MASQGNPCDENDQNDTSWSQPLTVETFSKMQQLSTSIGTLTLPPPPPPSRSSSSNSPRDSLQVSMPLPPLPFELILEILCRLPVKFLMTLMCVCKSWKTLISSNYKFSRKKLRMSTMSSHLILYFSTFFSHEVYPLSSFFADGTIDGTDIYYPFNREDNFSIVGSCDGIICLTRCCFHSRNENFIRPALWNPSTRKFNVLPSLDKPTQPKDGKNKFIDTYGFGYDHLSDKYKVVAVFMYTCKGDSSSYYVYKTQVKVHTLGTDSWKFIQDFPSVIFGAAYVQSGTFVNGTINWLVPPYSIPLQTIVSLDLGTESYQEILPPNYGAESVNLKLCVLKDCLCVIDGRAHPIVSDIWLMKEYGKRKSWTKLVSVPHMGFSDYYANKVLYISENDQLLLEFKKLVGSVFLSELVVYDPINSTLKIQVIDNFSDFWGPEIYIESLISPCS